MARYRFVVRELSGWPIRPTAGKLRRGHRPGLTVWVADTAYLGREVRIWRSEDERTPYFKHERMRQEARALARELNRQEAAA